MNLDIIIAVVALVGYFVFIYSTRKSKSFESYSVADRNVGFLLLFASLSANFIGPGFTLGLTQQGFNTGYFYLFIAGAYGIGKIIEGYFIAPKIREKFTDALSIGDVIAGEKSHNHKPLHFLVGLISFGLLIGLSIVMSKAAGEVLNNFLGVPNIIGTFIITAIVTGYSVFGGLKSTMMTDALQFIMFMVLMPVLAIISLLSQNFNLDAFLNNASSLTQNGFSEVTTIAIIGMVLSWMLGEMLMPFTINTVLAGKNSKTSQKALTYSGFLMIIWLFLMLTLGIIAKTVFPNLNSSDQILLHLGSSFFNWGLFGLFTVAIIGVIMSSQDALINCASVVFIQDMIKVFKPLNDEQTIKYSKYAGVLVGILSILFASFIPSIIEGLLFFYGIWVPSVLVIAIFSIFYKKPTYKAAIVALFVGIFTSFVWNLTEWKNVIPNILLGLILSSLVYLIVNYFEKKRIEKN